jgi:thioredoxin 1
MMNSSSGSVVKLTLGNHVEILTQRGIALVDCWASSCGACKVLGPIYAKVAEGHPEHTFTKLDTLNEDELTAMMGIVHVPTLILYRDGILLFKQAGNFDETRLEDIIAQAEALDMDVVRADIEAARASTAPRDGGELSPTHHTNPPVNLCSADPSTARRTPYSAPPR